MAYKIIVEKCTGCASCEFECPNRAISAKGAAFVISPGKCTECKGIYPKPQCLDSCLIPGAVVHA